MSIASSGDDAFFWQLVLPIAPIMARLIVALACAAGVSAFLAPSAPTAAPKTVVFGKGGELRDRKRQRPHVICTVAAAAASAAANRSAPQFTCKKTAGKRRNSRCAETSEKKNSQPRASRRDETPRGERETLRRGEPRTETPRRQKANWHAPRRDIRRELHCQKLALRTAPRRRATQKDWRARRTRPRRRANK